MISGIVAQQAMIVVSGEGGGGECDDYTMPTPTNVVTDLDTDAVSVGPTAIETNLCSEII